MSGAAPGTDGIEADFAADLARCVHCGLCLEHCPTYRLTRLESNSPRGRLTVWRALLAGELAHDDTTDFYLDECVGCLACEANCPANVPYHRILARVRAARVAAGKPVDWRVRLSAWLVPKTTLFQLAGLPARVLRRLGLPLHKFVFPGQPAVFESTAAYARRLQAGRPATGPRVAVFTGCLMESVFREINFATVRILVANGVRVEVPTAQACCGAIAEHAGLPGKTELDRRNREAFDGLGVEAVIADSAGCGLALRDGIETPVVDIMSYLGRLELAPGRRPATDHVYVDLPCHLCHGMGVHEVPANIFHALGDVPWSLAPDAEHCCGSGGTYNVVKPENAERILEDKIAFLRTVPHAHCTVVTVNHVCQMQWYSAIHRGRLDKRAVTVTHIAQLLADGYA